MGKEFLVTALKDQPITRSIFCSPFMDLLPRVWDWVKSLSDLP